MSKSDRIRQILERDADAKPSAIIAELEEDDVVVSKDLVKKVRLDWRRAQQASEAVKQRSQATSTWTPPKHDFEKLKNDPPSPVRSYKFDPDDVNDPWEFDEQAFLNGFSQYLKSARLPTVTCACINASPEAWFQIEALAWLDANRELVGIENREWWDICCEKAKTDIWLQYAADHEYRLGVVIELKVIFNNKNFHSKIREVRRDVSKEKSLPTGFSDRNTQRLGLIVAIYVKYTNAGGYKYLREKRQIVTSERFHEMIDEELASDSDWYRGYTAAKRLDSLQSIACLDEEPGIDPESGGNGVWLGFVAHLPDEV